MDRFFSRRANLLRRAQEAERQRVPEATERLSPSVLSDFDPVVAEAAESTAVVLHHGHQIALATVISADGYLITKASVLPNAIKLRLGQRVFEPELVGEDEAFDLALLKIAPKGLELKVCDWTAEDRIAAGRLIAAPRPLSDILEAAADKTLSAGVVSVAARSPRQQRAFLGVQPSDHEQGALVEAVVPGTTAHQIGLVSGDVIVGLNRQRIGSRNDLFSSIEQLEPGDQVEIEYLRNRERRTATSQMGSQELSLARLHRFDMMNQLGVALSDVRAGFPVVIEHDMLIHADECGGPIVDLSRQVVGINIARAGRTKTYAIPSKSVRAVIKRLKEGRGESLPKAG